MAYCEVLFINGNPYWAAIPGHAKTSLRKFLKEKYKNELAKENYYDDDDDEAYMLGEENEWGYTEAGSYHQMIDMVRSLDRVYYDGEFLSLETLILDPDEDYVRNSEIEADYDEEEPIDFSLYRDIKTGDPVYVAYFDNWSDHEAIAAFSAHQPNLLCDGQPKLILS